MARPLDAHASDRIAEALVACNRISTEPFRVVLADAGSVEWIPTFVGVTQVHNYLLQLTSYFFSISASGLKIASYLYCGIS